MIHRNNPTVRNTYLYRIYDRHGALLYVGTADGPDLRLGAHGNRHRRWWPEAAAARWERFHDPDEAAYAERVAAVLESPRHGTASGRLQPGTYSEGGRLCPELELELERYGVVEAEGAKYRSLRLLAARKWCEALDLWRRGRREDAAGACDWINYFGAELQKISRITEPEFEKMLASTGLPGR
ncbi:GIY-YIG nuclease family protein [Arthrobacter sp. I2-34]|uniref:GIY-YIG nuclease family protein n=1 Tax=Arthrobacter hankyongi TaxID=2904801 RepID=A0ABS9L681_9MICC|nr:GIY-YIG nuclease family protein [Arthrobacter hankyongi]MCG2622185.1 GIY-YIG nuclease family protein [Arthrobacter hankyongi]